MTERPSTDRRPDDISTWSGAYVLGALSAEETREFEAYLLESEQARHEVTELSDTAVVLGLAAQPEAPSPQLKQNLFAMLDATPQLPALDAEEAAATATSTPDTATSLRAVPAVSSVDAVEAEPAAAPVTPAEQRAGSRWFQRPATLLAGVAAATALVLGGGYAVTTLNDRAQDQQVAQQFDRIESAPDAESTTTEIERGGSITVVWSEQLQQSAVRINGLESLSPEQIYELWYIDAEEGSATPAGLFAMPEDGMQRVVLDGEMERGAVIGVTVEKAGGATTPSDDLVVAVATA